MTNSRHEGRDAAMPSMLDAVTSESRGSATTPAPRRQVRVGCTFVHDAPSAVHVVLQVEPHPDTSNTILSSTWTIPGGGDGDPYSDIYGNRCRRLVVPAGESTLTYAALVDASGQPDPVAEGAQFTPASELPAETLLYTLPSRFCPSDEMGSLAFELFGSLTPGWDQITAISGWVNNHLTFRYGSSTPYTTARDAYESGEGVCRDFTHLTVTFARALGFPTRYAFGYLPDIDIEPDHAAMDFAAWCEVYLNGRWWTVDARNHGVRRTGRVVIGRGRDALDVAMVTAFGRAPLRSMVVVAEEATAATSAGGG